MSKPTDYIGDGAYYANDGYGVELTTSNGIHTTNTVYLEPQALVALLRLLGRDFDRAKLKAAIGEDESDGGES